MPEETTVPYLIRLLRENMNPAYHTNLLAADALEAAHAKLARVEALTRHKIQGTGAVAVWSDELEKALADD